MPDDIAVNHWVDENNQPVNCRMFEEIAEYLVNGFIEGRTSGRLLEIGCGNSLILAEVSLRLGASWELHGLDISEEMLRRVAVPRVKLTCAEANCLPFAEGSFDLIFMHSVTQYFGTEAYLRDVLHQCARALRPGGHLCILDVSSAWHAADMGTRSLWVKIRRKFVALVATARIRLTEFCSRTVSSGNYQIENVGGKRVLVPKFEAYYADPDVFFEFAKYFRTVALEIQPFREKPRIYRKYRFNAIMKDRNRSVCN